MADIDTLLPDRNVTVNGETIIVRPFRFSQIPAASALIAKYTHLFSADKTDLDLVALIADGGEDIFKLMCLSIDKPRSFLDALDADLGMELLATVVEVNYDFFTRKLMPLMTTRLTSLAALVGRK